MVLWCVFDGGELFVWYEEYGFFVLKVNGNIGIWNSIYRWLRCVYFNVIFKGGGNMFVFVYFFGLGVVLYFIVFYFLNY